MDTRRRKNVLFITIDRMFFWLWISSLKLKPNCYIGDTKASRIGYKYERQWATAFRGQHHGTGLVSSDLPKNQVERSDAFSVPRKELNLHEVTYKQVKNEISVHRKTLRPQIWHMNVVAA